MKTITLPASLLATAVLLAACGQQPASTSDQAAGPQVGPAPGAEVADANDVQAVPVDAFLARISQHCGQAFAGRIIENTPAQPDDAFEGKALVMHVRECSPEEVKIPFHVGDDHSRTWVLTRLDGGFLRLKHDHRKPDGSDDPLTMYGGESAEPGTEVRQAFPVDQESIDLFNELGYDQSVVNTWAMEIEPGQRFLYELTRPTGRSFKVEFDLTAPVDLPPTPWGHPEID